MRLKSIALFAALALVGGAHAQVIDDSSFGKLDFGVSGFAALSGTPGTNWYHEGGVTGGEGGEVVTAENFQQLQAYCQSAKPYVILVTKPITTGIKAYIDASSTGRLLDDQSGATGVETTYGERILLASNKTIIGVGDDILISRITFVAQCQSNIIIRNLKFTMVGVPVLKSGENKIVAWRNGTQVEVGDPDIIGIQADANSAKTDHGSHIWVDHCEFFNGDAANKDRYDGLLDCKNNVQWITVSWNYFHNHDKSCLWGKGDSDIFDGCRTITCHHNLFKNIDGSRLPLQRGGHVHYYNNMQENCSDGWDLRSKAVAYAEACYFKNTKAPICAPDGGAVNISTQEGYKLMYDNCRRVIVEHEGVEYVNAPAKYDEQINLAQANAVSSWSPYDIEGYTASVNKTADVPALLEAYSGAGKLDIWKLYASEIPAVSDEAYQKALASALTAKTYDENGNAINSISESKPDGGSDVIDGEPIIFSMADDKIDFLWFSNATAVNSLVDNAYLAFDDASSFDASKDPSNSSTSTSKRGALTIAKEGGSATIVLPSCTCLKLNFFRTGGYNTDYEVSDDGLNWTKVKSSSDTKGELVVDLTSFVKSDDKVYVRIVNKSTGGLHLLGILAYGYGESLMPTAIEDVSSDNDIVSVDLFDLSGARISGVAHGLVVERTIYVSGNVRSRKIIVR